VAATQMRRDSPPIVPACHAGEEDRTITAAATRATVAPRRASQSNHVEVKHWQMQMQGGTLLKLEHRGISSAAPNPYTPSCDTVLWLYTVAACLLATWTWKKRVREPMTLSPPGSASATFPAAVTNAISALDDRLGKTRL
jgi:hypothetical protein